MIPSFGQTAVLQLCVEHVFLKLWKSELVQTVDVNSGQRKSNQPNGHARRVLRKCCTTILLRPKPILPKKVVKLQSNPLSVTLNVGPGDFQAAFSLASFNPAPDGFGNELIFAMHELDRNPSVLKQGTLRYPPQLKRKGLEGEVKLLVLIDERGKVKVLEVVSFSHPDFVSASRHAAETSLYEPPKRNGENVKVQFYLPVRFNLFE